jgi:hypothetical protein
MRHRPLAHSAKIQPVTTTWFPLVGLAVLWWLSFCATEVWLRRRNKPVEVGIADRRALSLLAIQVLAGAAVVLTDSKTLVVGFAALVVTPYLVTGAETLRRLKRR